MAHSGRRLKVFEAQFGFFDTVVAAPSRTAALRAWGVHQDLFAAGQARETRDRRAVEAALAQPGTPLKRAVGSDDPFAVEPASLPAAPTAPKRARPKPASGSKPRLPPKEEPPDRARLDAAEAALLRLEESREREEALFDRRAADLEAERAAAQAAWVAARQAAKAAVAEARRARGKARANPR